MLGDGRRKGAIPAFTEWGNMKLFCCRVRVAAQQGGTVRVAGWLSCLSFSVGVCISVCFSIDGNSSCSSSPIPVRTYTRSKYN